MTDAPPPAGHNTDTSADRLRSIVQRIERLNEDRAALGSDIKDIFTEAHSAGYDRKVLRALIRERRAEPAERDRVHDLLAVYRTALGLS